MEKGPVYKSEPVVYYRRRPLFSKLLARPRSLVPDVDLAPNCCEGERLLSLLSLTFSPRVFSLSFRSSVHDPRSSSSSCASSSLLFLSFPSLISFLFVARGPVSSNRLETSRFPLLSFLLVVSPPYTVRASSATIYKQASYEREEREKKDAGKVPFADTFHFPTFTLHGCSLSQTCFFPFL